MDKPFGSSDQTDIQDERCLGIDFHVEDDEVDRNEKILNFDQNVLRYSCGVENRLVRKPQTHGSRGNRMMVKSVIDYLWHDAVDAH